MKSVVLLGFLSLPLSNFGICDICSSYDEMLLKSPTLKMSINKAIKEGGNGNKKALFSVCGEQQAATTSSRNRPHPSGRGPDTSVAQDKLNRQAFTSPQTHQSKHALDFRAVIGAGKALAGSQNKSSSGGLPGSQLTKIYSGRMQSAELGVRRSSGLQTWASAAALRPTSGGAVTISVRPF